MGLRSPFGYVEYEVSFLDIFILLLHNFCGGCHTEDDFGSCENCPVGNLIFKSKKYLLEAYEPGSSEDEHGNPLARLIYEEAVMLRSIKKEIEPIKPHPCFDDLLINLRKMLLDLRLNREQAARVIQRM